jgi:hypothetical protein
VTQAVIEVVVGLIMIAAGLVLVIKREGAARQNVKALRLMHGPRAESAVRDSTPTRLAFIGVVAIVLGLGLLSHGIILFWSA